MRSRTLDSSSSRFLRNSSATRPRSRSTALSTSPVVTTMLMNPSIRSSDSLTAASAKGPRFSTVNATAAAHTATITAVTPRWLKRKAAQITNPRIKNGH